MEFGHSLRFEPENQKSLNSSYNYCYNFNTQQKGGWSKLLDWKNVCITFNAHLFERKEYWNLDLNKIEETVRTGKLTKKKCAKPNKLCFEKYFGKENLTYVVIVRRYKHFIEVKIAWPRKGR